jgi:anti-sigma factor RsiW
MNHDTIVELLPWYVNGTLPPHERAAVESELASCPRCAAELEELKRLHDTLHQIDADAPGPSEQLFARTLARVDESQTERRESPLQRWWNSLPAFGRALVFVPALLVIVLVVVTLRTMKPAENAALAPQRETPVQGVAGVPAAAPPVSKTLNALTTRSASTVSGSVQPEVANDKLTLSKPANVSNVYSVNQPAPAAEAIPPAPASNLRIQRPQLIRTGSMSLIVPDVEHAIAQMSALAQTQFGDVVSLTDETPSQPGVRHTASMQLSVPADRFDQTLGALTRLGAVSSRSIGAENVSDQIVDAQARLRNLRRTEADMLRILDRAGKIPDVLEVTQQIASVREQIEQLDGQLQSLQHRVAYSTISVDVQDEKPIAAVEPSTATQLNDAWQAALRNVRNFSIALASNVLVFVAYAPYWLPVTLVVFFIGYRLSRKQ